MSIIQEFKTFVAKGNAVDLAVGVIIGAAFGKIVTSLVSDIIMPPIGVLLGGVDFRWLAFTIKPAAAGSDAVTIKYGAFINTVIDFLIIAGAVFLIVRVFNKLHRKESPPPAPSRECPECLMSIPPAAKRCGHCGIVLTP